MHIGIVTTSFPRHEGDNAGNFIYGLARSLVKRENKVSVIAPSDRTTPKKENFQGISIKRFDYFPIRSLQTLCYGSGILENIKRHPLAILQLPILFLMIFLNSYRLAGQCDILHAYWSVPGAAAILAGKFRDKPVVLTAFGVEVHIDNPLSQMLTRWALNNASMVIAISKHTREEIFAMDLPVECVVIPFGIDLEPERIIGAHNKLCQKLGISKENKIIFALGRLVERKGFKYLIDAMPSVIEKTSARLVIGGSGPCQGELLSQIKGLHLEDYVFLSGFIPESDLSLFYQGCDVFVLPSIVDSMGDTEGLGMVLLEAQAYMKPVVASRVGGIDDIVKDGQNGYLVEPANSTDLAHHIICLLKHPTISENMGVAGRVILEQDFSWQRISEQIIQLYAKILRI